jgi:predicted CopG family antitoxin
VEKTSIKVDKKLLEELKSLKIHPREPYEDVIKRLVEKWRKST